MKPVSNETLLAQLQWRYATKKFDSARIIPEADWKTIEEALILTPSSFGLQPWRFYVVTNPELKKQLPPHSWGQNQPAEASHVVVFAIKKQIGPADVQHYLELISSVRGTPMAALKGYGDIINGYMVNPSVDVNTWITKQAYIALGNLMTSAAMLGIDVCPMEGIIPEKYDEILGIDKDGYQTVVVAPVGYRAADDKHAAYKKVRFPASEMVKHL